MFVIEIRDYLSEVLNSEFEVRNVSGVEIAKAEETGYVSNGRGSSPMI
jgi:hypothetical protein